MKKTNRQSHPSSFRDSSGFIFYEDRTLYRQVNKEYKENYDMLMNSGLYAALVDTNLLVKCEEMSSKIKKDHLAYKILKPEPVPFISYPYEWCFSQLKDAALATLNIQKTALKYEMSLKDASAYNIQFVNGKPLLIDTLSFEKYCEGQPWIAYRQFCQHFLAPIALMSHKDVRLNQLLKIYLDGIPLNLASTLLPLRTRCMLSLLSHIHLHSKSQNHFADKGKSLKSNRISRRSFLGLLEHLISTIEKLKWRPKGTEWAEYYDATNYSETAFAHKKEVLKSFLKKSPSSKTIWDLGANTGEFSRIASGFCNQVISFDIDYAAVEKNYLACVESNEKKIIPAVLDITNPSPGIGWENKERLSLLQRGPADSAIALALLHHLAISNNTPLEKIADFFSKACNTLIIEFIPKEDSQVKRLLLNREDIFHDYTQGSFEKKFKSNFRIKESVKNKNSCRTLYLMQKK
ncbi:MAG: SAM-dependent methyltransferase [Candidatus Aenigmarchaeota archaeon]|nr:SAM-dependent methyltransferase [Candidatus Aenigmarchaeota archaeon]